MPFSTAFGYLSAPRRGGHFKGVAHPLFEQATTPFYLKYPFTSKTTSAVPKLLFWIVTD